MNLTRCDDRFQNLVALTNAAALDQRKWQWFLKDLSEATGGLRVHLLVHDTAANRSLGHVEYGYDPDFIDSFDAYFGAHNVWARGYQDSTVGRAAHGSEVISDDDIEKTEFYTDWLRPQEDIIGRGFSVVERASNRLTLLGGNLRRQERDQLEEPFVSLLQDLSPFVQHAMQVSRMLGELTLENNALREGMEPDITATFALDSSGRVHFANRRAERMLDKGDLVRQDARARLRFSDPRAGNSLGRNLQDHFQPDVTIGLPFFARNGANRQFLCRTTPVGPFDAPLPWLSSSGTPLSGFVLLMIGPVGSRSDLFRVPGLRELTVDRPHSVISTTTNSRSDAPRACDKASW